jgi:hypothetical protein
MTDEDLERFEQRRQERLQRDRTFTFCGATLTHKKDVSPEPRIQYDKMRRTVSRQLAEAKTRIEDANGTPPALHELEISDEEMIQAADDTILAWLEPESHAAWLELRSPDADFPLNYNDILWFVDYLGARIADIPTVAPIDSSDGRKKTGSESKEGLSSTDREFAISPSANT